MNDDHIFWSRRLDEYVDGELNDTGAVEIEEHLAGCAACREELGLLTELRDAVRGLPAEIQPPRALWQGIEARIAPGAASSFTVRPLTFTTILPAPTQPG